MIRFQLQRFAGEKTERATPARRREVRQEGRVPKSPELTSSMVLLALVVGLKVYGPHLWDSWLYIVETGLTSTMKDFTPTAVQALFVAKAWWMIQLLAPFLAIALVIGVGTAVAQVGPLFLPNAIIPDFKRVHPLEGIKRLWSTRTLVESAKSILKLLVIGIALYVAVQGQATKLAQLSNVDVSKLVGTVGQIIFQAAIEVAALLLCLAFLDYLFQRWEFERSIRMSQEEIREEMKKQEGNQEVRAMIRRRGRALAMRRMMQAIPDADVVVTNPTHFAVALKYDAAAMTAPVVLAKGQDEIARRIRELARESQIPLVENKPLAQSLYKTVEIGQMVPPDLFQAVAEVLAYVYRLRGPSNRR